MFHTDAANVNISQSNLSYLNNGKQNLPGLDLSHLILHKMNLMAPKARQLDFIVKEISNRMLDRLDYIKISPEHVLDIGSGMGIDKKGLGQHYPKSAVYSIDFALQMLTNYHSRSGVFSKKYKNLICANALNLPIAAQSIDLVWSNLCLPYISNLEQYFIEINRVLKLGGTFLVSGFGIDSLKQLRELGLATFNFPDMHLIGDILVELGFTNPVTDLEYITLEYNTLSDLLSDIRIVGCGSGLRHHISIEQYKNLDTNFNNMSRNGKLGLTLEIFYAHAWKDKVRQNLVSGRNIIQFIRS